MKIASKEISAQIEQIIAGASKLDVDAAMKPYLNDLNFRIVNPDGSIQNYEAMRKSAEEAFKTFKSLKYSTVKQNFTFVAPDSVICTWTGIYEFELKDGTRMKIEPYVGSMLFRRVGSEWKIIYAHETTGQPAEVAKQK